MRARHLLPFALVGVIGLTACGSSQESSDPPSASDATEATPLVEATAPSASEPPSPPAGPAPGAPPPTAPSATSPGTAAPGTAAPVAVPAALDFSAPLVGGGQIEMGSLAGKPVVLWFWAPF